MAERPMPLIDSQGHSPVTSTFKWDLSCSHAAVDKISTDIACHVVALR